MTYTDKYRLGLTGITHLAAQASTFELHRLLLIALVEAA
jgi:hypothetical protein